MLYTLELGTTEQGIAKQAMRSGQPIPERIANAPTLREGLFFYLQAFFDLDSDRSQGMGMGRIPWSSIVRYIEYHDIDEDQSEYLFRYLRALDTAYLNHLGEKNARS